MLWLEADEDGVRGVSGPAVVVVALPAGLVKEEEVVVEVAAGAEAAVTVRGAKRGELVAECSSKSSS